MTIAALDNIERIPLAIDYRRMYRAAVAVSVGNRATLTSRIEFSLELSPFGGYDISVSFLDTVDYPTVPAIRIIKEYIKAMDQNGELP